LSPKAILAPMTAESQDVRPGRELWATTQAIAQKGVAAERQFCAIYPFETRG